MNTDTTAKPDPRMLPEDPLKALQDFATVANSGARIAKTDTRQPYPAPKNTYPNRLPGTSRTY